MIFVRWNLGIIWKRQKLLQVNSFALLRLAAAFFPRPKVSLHGSIFCRGLLTHDGLFQERNEAVDTLERSLTISVSFLPGSVQTAGIL